ncbi:hypothetical protein AB4K05_11615 [Kluyvera sp. STS39-E]|uniref:hypothetical protein n=1 Tax=Kluyvera sp. STS39-E TaxID=3234748 RepID=UPI0034C68F3D
MTVSTEVDHNDYIGNGVTTTFPYTFRIFSKSDLVVTVVDLDENLTELTPDTDYTVTGAGGYTGGNVILMVPLATGWKISISRDLPITQETDLRNQGKFFAEVHELAFDKLTMLVQQIRSMYTSALRKPSTVANWFDAQGNYIRNVRDPKEPQDAATKNYADTSLADGLSHTLRTPEAVPQLPAAVDRRNKIPAFDNDGNPTVIPAPSGSAAEVYLELAKPTGAGLVGATSGKTVQQELDGTLKAANNLSDLEDPAEARENLGITYGYLGETFWHDNRAKVPDGTVAADGQQVDQVGPFADLYADVAAGNRPSCTEAEWQADPTKRGCYVLNSATGKMRLPDRNGVQSGSIKAPVLRGDGATLAAGSVQKSGVPNVKTFLDFRAVLTNGSVVDEDPAYMTKTLSNPGSSSAGQLQPNAPNGTYTRVGIDFSKGNTVFQDGLTEARMNSLPGCFVIRFAGHAQNAGELDALTLATRIESVNSDLQAKNIATNARIGYALLSVINPALNSRTVLQNPFGNNTPVWCMTEIFHATLQKWVTTPWMYSSAPNAYGINSAYAEGEGIVCRAGRAAFVALTQNSGASQEFTSDYATPSPVRIHVWKVTA